MIVVVINHYYSGRIITLGGGQCNGLLCVVVLCDGACCAPNIVLPYLSMQIAESRFDHCVKQEAVKRLE